MFKFLLYPFSWLYGLGVSLRNQAYDLDILKSREFEVPVISIGNITVGGTGKTPHVEYLVDLLKDKYKVATLSRGYKRKTKGFRLVEVETTAIESGDEPLQIKTKFPDVTVSVCEDRAEGIDRLLNQNADQVPDVILLDDAFQHRSVTPGINILLIDYNRQLKDDHLLPAGRLRERAHQARRANIIIFTKCPDEVTPIMRRILQNDVGLLPYQSLFFTKLEYDKLKPVFNGKKPGKTFYEEKQHAVLLVTGIANPALLIKHVKKFALSLKTISYPDHHSYSDQDIKNIQHNFDNLGAGKKIIITTEKDAMRFKDTSGLSEGLKSALYYVPVRITYLDEGKRVFNKKILNYVGENKSNRELYKRKNSGQS
ncbi:MAG TPA: tetraacyldisaccharide 4'-kinase [Draconibacterium sp.]|nr:tetraacyldisaccharide 4'-kinase [Draconibacterium sp.]